MNLNNILKAMSSLYRVNLNDEAIAIFKLDLSDFTEDQIIKALTKCRYELKYFPTIADIRERIETGHLEPNEAWALCPKNDNDSVCWTKQIEQSYYVARELILEGDLVAARMAFIENYKKQLSEAKANKIKPKWYISLGYNKDHRIAVAKEAIEKKLITLHEGQKYLPDIEQTFEPEILKLINNIVKEIE